MLQSDCHIPFLQSPVLTEASVVFPSYRQGSSKALILAQKVEKMLKKCALESSQINF